MANDSGSAMDMLKGLLGDDAENKIGSILQNLSSSGTNLPSELNTSESAAQNSGDIDTNTLEYIMRMKNIVDEMSHGNDERSNLLLSLRPYMRQQRQKSIDSALRLMTLTKLSGMFKL